MKHGFYSRYRWLDAATRGIRFGPDRTAVRQELTDHLEDKIANLKRVFPDMDDREAEQRALAQMGDAEEIGKELSRIHKPWLGYLWRASQAILLLVVVLFAAGLMKHMESNWFNQVKEAWRDSKEFHRIEEALYENQPSAVVEETEFSRWDWPGGKLLALYPHLDQEQRLGEASVTLSRAALWQVEGMGQVLYTQVSIAYDKPWEKSKLLTMYLQAEDSLGNHYGYKFALREDGASMSGMGSLGQQSHWNGYTWNFILHDIPEQAEWVRFTYGLIPNGDFSFFIDLSGEVEI